jgi:hypothetical protein
MHGTRWTSERIARLGFLVGLGLEAKQIAGDPIIDSTPNNVFRQAQRFGLGFREASAAIKGFATEPLEQAATKRGISYEKLVRNLLHQLSSDPCLIDNVLDDGEI